MAVALAQSCYIVPIQRDAVDPLRKDLLARWHYFCYATGDASGGNVQLSGDLISGIGAFGKTVLWDVRFVGARYSPVLAGQEVWFEIKGSEISSQNIAIVTQGCIQPTGTSIANVRQMRDFPDPYKWRLTTAPGATGVVWNPSVNIIFGTNTNLSSYEAQAGGYIYDERFVQ